MLALFTSYVCDHCTGQLSSAAPIEYYGYVPGYPNCPAGVTFHMFETLAEANLFRATNGFGRYVVYKVWSTTPLEYGYTVDKWRGYLTRDVAEVGTTHPQFRAPYVGISAELP